MSYLSFVKGKKPIAVITSGNLRGDIIYLYNDRTDKVKIREGDKLHEFIIPNDAPENMFPVPAEQDLVYCSGPNGCGKTSFLSQYLKYLKRLFPNCEIILFSDVDEDPLLDDLGVIRIPIDQRLVDEPIEPKLCKNSAVIFDDIDSIRDKKVKSAVITLRDSLLKTSRHYNIQVLCTNHITCDGQNTKGLINECKMLVLYPDAGNNKHINYILKTYMGITKEKIDFIFSLAESSRWVAINKSYPYYVIWEKGVSLL